MYVNFRNYKIILKLSNYSLIEQFQDHTLWNQYYLTTIQYIASVKSKLNHLKFCAIYSTHFQSTKKQLSQYKYQGIDIFEVNQQHIDIGHMFHNIEDHYKNKNSSMPYFIILNQYAIIDQQIKQKNNVKIYQDPIIIALKHIIELIKTQSLMQKINTATNQHHQIKLSFLKQVFRTYHLSTILPTINQYVQIQETLINANRFYIYQSILNKWYKQQSNINPHYTEEYLIEVSQLIAFIMYINDNQYITIQDIQCNTHIKSTDNLMKVCLFQPKQHGFSFIDVSLKEFHVVNHIVNEIIASNWNYHPDIILKSKSLCNLILQYFQINKSLYTIFLNIVLSSKTIKQIEKSAAAAITILNFVGFPFSGMDLSGINIPFANLKNGYFLNTNLQDSNLLGVKFNHSYCKGAKFNRAEMRSTQFQEEIIYFGQKIIFDIDTTYGFMVVAVNVSIIGFQFKSAKKINQLITDSKIIMIKCLLNYNIITLESENIKFWNLSQGVLLKILHYQSCTHIFPQPNGFNIALVSNWVHSDFISILIYDYEQHQIINQLKLSVIYNQYNGISCICYSNDGQILAISTFSQFYILNAKTGNIIQKIQQHTTLLCISPNNLKLATVSTYDVKIWDINNINQIKCIYSIKKQKNYYKKIYRHSKAQGFRSMVYSIQFSYDSKKIMISSSTGIKIYDLQNSINNIKQISQYQSVHIISLPNNIQIVANTNTSLIKQSIFNQEEYQMHQDFIKIVCYSPDGTKIITGSQDKRINIWNSSNGSLLKTIKGHCTPILALCYSFDGKQIFSGGGDQIIKIWNAQTGNQQKVLKGHHGTVTSLNASNDGKSIVSGSYDKTIRIWDYSNGKHMKILKKHKGHVYSVCYSPDSKKITSGSQDKSIIIWDAQTGATLQILLFNQIIHFVKYSPDGMQIIGCEDDLIRILNAETGNIENTLKGHTEIVNSVCFSSDGNKIVSGSNDKNIRIWDTRTGQHIKLLQGHLNKVLSVCFSPIKNNFVSCGSDKNIKIWDTSLMDSEQKQKQFYPIIDIPHKLCLQNIDQEDIIANNDVYKLLGQMKESNQQIQMIEN